MPSYLKRSFLPLICPPPLPTPLLLLPVQLPLLRRSKKSSLSPFPGALAGVSVARCSFTQHWLRIDIGHGPLRARRAYICERDASCGADPRARCCSSWRPVGRGQNSGQRAFREVAQRNDGVSSFLSQDVPSKISRLCTWGLFFEIPPEGSGLCSKFLVVLDWLDW